MRFAELVVLLLTAHCALADRASRDMDGDNNLITTGVGIADVTGPVTEIDFMGYAFPTQTGQGIHLRLFSRAFIFLDANGNRAVYVSMDLAMSMMSFKEGVVQRLADLGYGALYNESNVLLSGIHTHSGPGAYSWFLLYDISMLGLNKQHLAAIVEGVTQSILNAHADLALNAPAPLYLAQGLLANANINRSPTSYLANPAAERAQYEQWGGDTDHNMTLLRVSDGRGRDRGAVSFFAVHCTSMHNTNRLVSSDNKGYASYMMERAFNGNASLPGQGYFVAAFGQSNLGDVSPNTLGAWCNGRVGGVDCSGNRSLCDGWNEPCVGVGPTGLLDDAGSAAVIGGLQAGRAQDLWKAAVNTSATGGPGVQVTGGVRTVHTWVNMSGLHVDAKYTTTGVNATTCRPAVGFAFAAGTTDGPGAFNFYQGDNCTTCMPFWEKVRNLLKKPTPEQAACHGVKPILLDVGEMEPYPWVPAVLPLQIVEIGSLIVLAVPCEFTTMAGRRLRAAVHAVYAAHGRGDVVVVIAGLSNAYSQYTATYEEYQYQRYEAASTLYGPHQLAAYTQEFVALATALLTNTPVSPGVPHPATSTVDFYLFPENPADTHPAGSPFGAVLTQPPRVAVAGTTVNATFQGANLRNNFMQGGSFMLVQQSAGASGWTTVMTDGNWETKVHWAKQNHTESVITTQWDIPEWMPPGTYRFVHQGYYKPEGKGATPQPYQGGTAPFQVVAPSTAAA